MPSQLLVLAGNVVKSINPSLLSSPPPSSEESGQDVCYLGPKGEEDDQHLIYCKDLPEGMREYAGSWYIHPERHAFEYIAFVTISSIIIRMLLPTFSQYPAKKAQNLTPPLWMKISTLSFYVCQVAYKLNGYPGKILFMAMPCNVVWTLWMTLCFCSLKPQTMHIIHQLIIPYTILSVVAVATPDLSGLDGWMEVPFFFIIHIAQISHPTYFLITGRVSVLPDSSGDGLVSTFFKWWTLACAYFGLFYFGVIGPVSLLSGINLNYMLSPPPSPGMFIVGPNFRLQSTIYCAVAFFFCRLLVTAIALFGRAWNKSSSFAPKKDM